MKWYQKLRKLPERRKKAILWVTIIVIGIILLFFWAKTTAYRFHNLGQSNVESIINVPESGNVWTDIEKFWDRQDLDNIFPDELTDIPGEEEPLYQENNE